MIMKNNFTKLLLTIFFFITMNEMKMDFLLLDLDRIYIQDFNLSKCDTDTVYPVSVENVTLQLGNDGHIIISGTLNTSDELTSPIKASVTLKKKTWMGWIYMPCEKNMGSCNYDDLCSYGYPENKECPPDFVENNVPCRCPIKPGTYTLPPKCFLVTKNRSIFSGKYKGNIFISHNSEQLACYNVNFTLIEKLHSNLLISASLDQ